MDLGTEGFGPGRGMGAIIAVVVLGFAIVIGLAIWQERRRAELRRQRAAAAAAQGWTFTDKAPELVGAYDCAPFGTGKGRKAGNCVTGAYRGVPFCAFDYQYYTESTSTDAQGHTTTTRHHHRFEVAVLRLRSTLPDLDLQPQGVLTRLVDAVTGADIDLEWESFNRAYRLTCRDRKFAFDTFHARTMEYLVARGRAAFCFVGGDVLVYRKSGGMSATIWGPGDQSLTVDQSAAPLDMLLVVLRGIPPFVWQDRGGLPPALAQVRW